MNGLKHQLKMLGSALRSTRRTKESYPGGEKERPKEKLHKEKDHKDKEKRKEKIKAKEKEKGQHEEEEQEEQQQQHIHIINAKGFSEEELKDLRTAFDLLDRNGDGRVTSNELQFMLRNLGIHVRDELIDGLMTQASNTGNGLIDEAEFLQWIGRIQALKEESESANTENTANSTTEPEDDITQDLIAAFRVFDRDGNGYITKDELQTAMDMIGETVTETQLSEMLALADLDKDGKINYEEFARLLL